MAKWVQDATCMNNRRRGLLFLCLTWWISWGDGETGCRTTGQFGWIHLGSSYLRNQQQSVTVMLFSYDLSVPQMEWHLLFIVTYLSLVLYCWPAFTSSLTLLTPDSIWQLNTLDYSATFAIRTDTELIAAFLFPIYEVTWNCPCLNPARFPIGIFSFSVGFWLNVSLQVCLVVKNGIRSLLTFSYW